MIDNVETNLAETNNYMEKAVVNLETAKVINKGNKKKMCCIMVCMCVVALIFVTMLSGVVPF